VKQSLNISLSLGLLLSSSVVAAQEEAPASPSEETSVSEAATPEGEAEADTEAGDGAEPPSEALASEADSDLVESDEETEETEETEEAPTSDSVSDAEPQADPNFESDLAKLSKDEGEEPKARKKRAPKKEPEDVDYSSLPLGHHQMNLGVFAGMHFTRATSEGLEPFAEESSLVEGAVRAGGGIYASGPLSLAVFAGLAGGSTEASVREQSSSLSLFHLNLAAEGRYHLHHRIYGYGRLSGGPEWSSASLGPEGAEDSLSGDALAFRGDANLGAAFRFAGSSDGRKRAVRAVAFVEGGYRFSSNHSLQMEVDEGSGPVRAESFELDPFSTQGLAVSFGVGLSY